MSGTVKLAGVMGFPVGHSKSPQLHGFWLRKYHIKGHYLPLSVPEDQLSDAFKGLKAMGFRGCNVTIPHKQAACRLCDDLTPTARKTGAVNTVVVSETGDLTGDNTDGFGFIENITQNCRNFRFAGATVAVLGAGGAARGILVALLAAGIGEIRLLNRTRARAEILADRLGDNRIHCLDWETRSEALDGVHLLVNTTSLGMTGQPPLSLSLSALPKTAMVTDIVYAPLITPLLEMAQQQGFPMIDGLGMLLHQARPGFEAWFGHRPQVDTALRAHILGA